MHGDDDAYGAYPCACAHQPMHVLKTSPASSPGTPHTQKQLERPRLPAQITKPNFFGEITTGLCLDLSFFSGIAYGASITNRD